MTADDFASRPDYGTCPVCGRPYQLTTKSRIRKHWKRDGQGKGLPFSDSCPGSGRSPADTTQEKP